VQSIPVEIPPELPCEYNFDIDAEVHNNDLPADRTDNIVEEVEVTSTDSGILNNV